MEHYGPQDPAVRKEIEKMDWAFGCASSLVWSGCGHACSPPHPTPSRHSSTLQHPPSHTTQQLEEELALADTADKPRILLMGPRRSGKTSIERVVFHKMSPHETLFLESTHG